MPLFNDLTFARAIKHEAGQVTKPEKESNDLIWCFSLAFQFYIKASVHGQISLTNVPTNIERRWSAHFDGEGFDSSKLTRTKGAKPELWIDRSIIKIVNYFGKKVSNHYKNPGGDEIYVIFKLFKRIRKELRAKGRNNSFDSLIQLKFSLTGKCSVCDKKSKYKEIGVDVIRFLFDVLDEFDVEDLVSDPLKLFSQTVRCQIEDGKIEIV